MESTTSMVTLSSDQISFFSEASFPTEYGIVRVVVFKDQKAAKIKNQTDEHVALVFGDVGGSEPVLVRIHSECWTGEVLHSLKCDCREQFDAAITTMAKVGRGIIVYLRQEGRGIGLGNKIKAYALQGEGLDTFEANRALGFEDDMRDFTISGKILSYFGVSSVYLLTNNPLKIEGLNESGVRVVGRKPLPFTTNPYNHNYIKDKNFHMNHDIRGCNNIETSENLNVTFSSSQIALCVEELARKVAHDYAGQELVMISVLPNSFMFYGDLLRQIWHAQEKFNLAPITITCDFMAFQHYESEDRTIFKGILKNTKDLSISITGKRVLLVDCISNTSDTMSYLCETLMLRKPLDIKTCALFNRPHKSAQDFEIDYVGFKLENDDFIRGYGIGHYNQSQGLPFVFSDTLIV